MKKLIYLLSFVFIAGSITAQKKTTTSATVSFDASTPKDALPKAENNTVIASVDTKTGVVAFEAAVNNFSFSNPTIQQHFNEAKWMNSEQFPKFTFNGKLDKLKKIKFNKDGTYKVKVTGGLTVKGITKQIKTDGVVTILNGKISVVSSFKIKLADFNISGPAIEAGKVDKEPKITVTAEF